MKLGFDLKEHQEDARRRYERAEDMELKHDANEIANRALKISKRALWIPAAISVAALIVAIVR